MAKPAWRQQVRFLDAYKRQQESIEGGKIDPFLFKVLSGDEGGVRLGSGFTEKEKRELAFLGNERSRRQALKRQFEIADKTKEYGSAGTRVGPQGRITQSKDDQIKYTGAAAGGAVTAGAATGAATVGATTGSYAFGAALGAGTVGAFALPIAAVAAGILVGVGEHEKKQAKKKKKKLRSLGAAQALTRNVRGFTPTGALLSREGAMRIARSKVKDTKAK
tara:strand:+ start:1899 stop:2558 length:660 start_codon:yes stop_codon:yes gene_type:complete